MRKIHRPTFILINWILLWTISLIQLCPSQANDGQDDGQNEHDHKRSNCSSHLSHQYFPFQEVPLQGNQMSSSSQGAYEVTLASTSRGYALVWYDTRNDETQIYGKEIDEDGKTIMPESQLSFTQGKSYEPHTIWMNSTDQLAITWYEVLPSGEMVVHLLLLNAQKEPILHHEIKAPGKKLRNPLLLWNGQNLALTWISEVISETSEKSTHIQLQLFDPSGLPQSPIQTIGMASPTTWNLNGHFLSNGELKLVYHATPKPSAGRSFPQLKQQLFILEGDIHQEKWRQTVLNSSHQKENLYPDISAPTLPSPEGPYFLTWFSSEDSNKPSQKVHLAQLLPSTTPKQGPKLTHMQSFFKKKRKAMGSYLAFNGTFLAIVWVEEWKEKWKLMLGLMKPNSKAPLWQVTIAQHHKRFIGVPAIVAKGSCFGISWNDMRNNEFENDYSHSQIYFQKICPENFAKKN